MALTENLWWLYQDDPARDEHPDAFEASDELTYPTLAWWKQANPPRKGADRPPRYPTRANYWTRHSLSRLMRPFPLKGESRKRATARAVKARSYAARLREWERQNREGAGKGFAEWRIVLDGYVAQVTDPARGPYKVTDGTQASPWERIARGRVVDNLTIRSRYLDTARRAVALVAKHAPAWGDELGTFNAESGYTDSDKGIVFPTGGVRLEVRFT